VSNDPESPRDRRSEDPSVTDPSGGAGHEAGGSDGAGGPPPSTWAGRKWRAQDDGQAEEEPGAEELSGDGLDELEGPPDEELEELPDEDAAELDADELAEDELEEEELEEDELAEGLDEDAEGGGADTVEADTLAIGDREAAREAALAGVRTRAAEHAAKQAKRKAAAAPVAEAEEGVAEEEAPPAGEAPDAEAAAPPTPPTVAPAAPDSAEKPPRRALWPRFVAGSLLILVSMATATAVSLLVYLTDLARGLGGLPSVRNQLEVADPGNPQTILILGSDKRPHGQEIAHSDTTILLRVAPSQITVMSIPRDLKVNIPGHGIDKFNVAYTYGGPKLTLKVTKQLTGLDNINHVVNVDFDGFADAVDAIGCVYVDVDRHYYHSNVGLAADQQYAEINIPAGYQRMCGYKALQFVRYRHDDNDLVRAARQQEFLRETRQELPPSKLLADRNRLIDILKKYVTSDIDSPPKILELAKLFLAARNAPVIQVHFPASLGGPNAAYVTASQSAIREAVTKFEGEVSAPPTTPEQPAQGGSASKGPGNGPGKHAPPPLIDSSSSGHDYAEKLAATKTGGGRPMLDFPVRYPTKLAPNSTLTGDSRAFPIDGPGDDVFHGYKIVAAVPSEGYTAYYGFSGTDWKDPPILANPDETKTIGDRDYLLSWDAGRLRLVGWKTDHGSYWIDNTLLNVLTPGQMLGMAEAVRRYTG
jgi:polyisoprenyl-teichoic acid--peptidoglycan teichoic acid transferase